MKTNGRIQLFPLLRVAMFLICGIVCGDIFMGHMATSVLMILSFVLLLVSFFIGRYGRIAHGVMIMLTTFLFGAWITMLHEKELNAPVPHGYVKYQAVLISGPVEKGKVVRCDLLVMTGPMKGKKVKASILRDTVESRYKSLHVGDGIEAYSCFEKPYEYFSNSKFSYVRWLNVHGFVANTFIYYDDWQKERIDLSSASRMERVKIAALKLRETLVGRINRLCFNTDSYAIIAAMVLGEKSMLTPELKEAYSVSGVSHLLAISGMHLGIIYGMLLMLFGRISKTILGQLVIFFSIWSFAFIVGLNPSVVRAATMVSVYSAVSMLNRETISLNTLSLAAIIMLLINPLDLWDVGFQMSFMAMLGINILFWPIFHSIGNKMIMSSRVVKWLWTMIAISVSAQIMTFPLIMYYFGRFSCYSVVTNLWSVPTALVIIYMSFALLILSPLPGIQKVIAYGLNHIISFINDSFRFVASLPGSSMENININLLQLILIYVIIMSICVLTYYYVKMKRSLIG